MPGPRVRFGLIYTHLDGRESSGAAGGAAGYEAHWHQQLEHMAWAEQVGFESIWLTERHFSSYAPSPLVLAAAIAARTSTVRIATNLMVAPLYHPLRLAEESAMVSVLSGGRFDLGIGQGHRAIDFDAFGVTIRNRPSMLEESVQILRQAWTGESFSFHGVRFQIPEAAVTPVPGSPPRVLIGATSEAGIKRAARIGDGYLTPFNAYIKKYLNALQAVDPSIRRPVFAAQQAVVAEDPQREWARVGPFAMRHVNMNLPRDKQFTNPDDVLAAKSMLLWDASTAVQQVCRLVETYPAIEDVHFTAISGPGERVQDSYPRLEFLARTVIPQIREGMATASRRSADRVVS